MKGQPEWDQIFIESAQHVKMSKFWNFFWISIFDWKFRQKRGEFS